MLAYRATGPVLLPPELAAALAHTADGVLHSDGGMARSKSNVPLLKHVTQRGE